MHSSFADTEFMADDRFAPGQPPIRPADIAPDQRSWLGKYRTWRRFHHGPRQGEAPLLKNLAQFRDAVLVAGCQRSGTTMLTRIIARSKGFQQFALTHDDELDAALILAGYVDVPKHRRYCFQTTYLNERYREYACLREHQRLIWVLRNPFSVVRSMVYNWKRFALNELYEDVGAARATSQRLRRAKAPWPFGPSPIEKACLAYSAKTSQVFAIQALVRPHQLLILEYDALVRDPARRLRRVFEFIDEPYQDTYASFVRQDSIHKADRLSRRATQVIEAYALPTYKECLALAPDDLRA
jgi:Sulfotransferase domain